MDLFPASVARGGKSRAQAKEQALQMKVVSYDRVHIQVNKPFKYVIKPV